MNSELVHFAALLPETAPGLAATSDSVGRSRELIFFSLRILCFASAMPVICSPGILDHIYSLTSGSMPAEYFTALANR